MVTKNIRRCWWCGSDPLYIEYHDKEWGRPVHDDKQLFEMLILEGFQAGLSWLTILKKREAFRKAFRGFEPQEVARFGAADKARLLRDSGIVRNKLKIEGSVINARGFLAIQDEFGSFDSYIWRFTDFETIIPQKRMHRGSIPATSRESDALSKDLKKRGFKFVGSTIMYAHMQATGMVNDHVDECFLSPKIKLGRGK